MLFTFSPLFFHIFLTLRRLVFSGVFVLCANERKVRTVCCARGWNRNCGGKLLGGEVFFFTETQKACCKAEEENGQLVKLQKSSIQNLIVFF